jgi:hypothetical protein
MYQIKFIEQGKGVIKIDGFEEAFESELSYWSQAQYEAHWHQAKETISTGNSACFITSITNPEHSNFIRTWACYPINGKLVFQECVLFLDELEPPFNANKPHLNVLPYESLTEDGEQISEWVTNA